MGKLRTYLGCMNSMKSSTLLLRAHQFEGVGCNVIVLKSKEDKRNPGVIHSRALKDKRQCYTFKKSDDLFELVNNIIFRSLQQMAYSTEINFESRKRFVLFVDESNLLTKEQVYQLWRLSKSSMYEIDVYVFGLKMTYKNKPFESAIELFSYSDSIEEIKSMCSKQDCFEKATTHLLYVNDIPVKEGNDTLIGDVYGSIRFESVCQCCWHKTHAEHEINLKNKNKKEDLNKE